MKLLQILAAAALTAALGSAPAQTLDNKGLVTFLQKNKSVSMKRDEFESLADTRARLSYLERDFSVLFTPSHSEYRPFYEYDADAQTLSVHMPSTASTFHFHIFEESEPPVSDYARWKEVQDVKWRTYALYSLNEKSSTQKWTGQNAYGVTRKVTSHYVEQWGVAVLNIDKKELEKLTVKPVASPAEARVLSKQLAWRLTGTTSVGLWNAPRHGNNTQWPVQDINGSSATISSPTSLTIVTYGAPALLTGIELIRRDTGETLWETQVQ